MSEIIFFNNLKNRLSLSDSVITTQANHLIVIFALSMPLLISVRRLSLVLIILLFLVRGRLSYYVGETIKDPVVKAFTIYFFVHIFWLIGTDDFSNAKSTVHDSAFLLIPLVFGSLIDKKFIPRIYGAFFIGMFASELISYGLFFDVLAPMIHSGGQGTAADPTPVYHHTHYGFMLATSLVLIVQRLVVGKNDGLLQVLLLIFFVSASINVFITGGRSGYVLYGIYLLMLMIFIYPRRYVKPVLVMISVVMVAFLLAFQMSATFKYRIKLSVESVNKIISDKDYANSIGGRIGIIDYSSDLVKSNWLYGLGTGDQTKEIVKEIRTKDKSLSGFFTDLGHPHNEYLSSLLQFGIIGLLAFINIPLQLLRYRNSDNEKRVMFRLLGIGVLLFTFMDVFVIGLGMLFTVLILVSAGLRSYITTDTMCSDLSGLDVCYYFVTIVIFYFIQMGVS